MKFPNSKWTLLSLAMAVLAVLMVIAATLGTRSAYDAQPGMPPATFSRALTPWGQ